MITQKLIVKDKWYELNENTLFDLNLSIFDLENQIEELRKENNKPDEILNCMNKINEIRMEIKRIKKIDRVDSLNIE